MWSPPSHGWDEYGKNENSNNDHNIGWYSFRPIVKVHRKGQEENQRRGNIQSQGFHVGHPFWTNTNVERNKEKKE
jgi:hypothetical protein